MADPLTCDSLTTVCAFRYALGRRTYVVDHVARWLIANRDKLDASDRALIVREIDQQRERGLGDACDEREWLRARDAMLGIEPCA